MQRKFRAKKRDLALGRQRISKLKKSYLIKLPLKNRESDLEESVIELNDDFEREGEK